MKIGQFDLHHVSSYQRLCFSIHRLIFTTLLSTNSRYPLSQRYSVCDDDSMVFPHFSQHVCSNSLQIA
jgi:hypothetical protein